MGTPGPSDILSDGTPNFFTYTALVMDCGPSSFAESVILQKPLMNTTWYHLCSGEKESYMYNLCFLNYFQAAAPDPDPQPEPVVLEAGHVYLLMEDEFRISRNARASWYLKHLNTTIRPKQDPTEKVCTECITDDLRHNLPDLHSTL